MKEFAEWLWVGAGGFFGAVARYGVARASAAVLGAGFPWGTFIVNISGSFLLGAVATLAAERMLPHSGAIRLAIAVGFIGAYTTFSTFEYETNALLEEGRWPFAIANVLGSVAAGFLALKLGIFLARKLG